MPRIKSLDSFSSVHSLIFVHAGKTIGSLTLRHVSYPQYCQKYRCSLTAYSCLKFVSNSLSGILTHKYTRIRGLFYAGIGEPRDTETYRRFSPLAYDRSLPFYLCIVPALTDSNERIALESCLQIGAGARVFRVEYLREHGDEYGTRSTRTGGARKDAGTRTMDEK